MKYYTNFILLALSFLVFLIAPIILTFHMSGMIHTHGPVNAIYCSTSGTNVCPMNLISVINEKLNSVTAGHTEYIVIGGFVTLVFIAFLLFGKIDFEKLLKSIARKKLDMNILNTELFSQGILNPKPY